MKRKIVRHGSSSLTVTLPVKWVQRLNLQKGDELDVAESGRTLVLSTEGEHAIKKKEVATSEYGIFTKNNLSHLYQLGYDEVVVQFDNEKTLDEIKQRLPDCIGFEIIDQKASRIFIKSIATTLESEFDTLLRKAFMITNEMARSVVECVEKRQYGQLRSARSLEALNNKFTDVCIRILNKSGYKQSNRTLQMHEIVKELERIADEFKYICDIFDNHSVRVEGAAVRLLREAVEYYLVFYELFYRFDPELKKTIYVRRKQLVSECVAQLKTARSNSTVLLHHCLNIIEKTYNAAGSYFALIL